MKVSVEVLWLGILVAFFRTVFGRTNAIAGWNEPQYFFFVGCFFAMNGLIEMLFLDNCNEFAELVRTGDLDGLLLKPIDEQFLITCRRIDWGTAPNILMGSILMLIALVQMHWHFDVLRISTFLVTVVCGTAIAYSFMLLLTSISVWMVRNQSLMEMWWLFSSVARYPKEIFAGRWAEPLGAFFTYMHADSGGRQCPGQRDGPGVRPADGRLDHRRRDCIALAQPPLFSLCIAVVSKRE